MRVTIDTKEDSRHEIKKVVDMLNAILEADAASGGAQGSQEPAVSDGIFGMFSGNNEETAPSSPSVGNELAGFFAENKEENVNLEDQKVVEGVKKGDDDEDFRIVPY